MSKLLSVVGLGAVLLWHPEVAAAQSGHEVAMARAVHIVLALSDVSPDLGRADKVAISQDIYGAPLDGAPRVHELSADSVFCRKRMIDGGAPADCDIDFGRHRSVHLRGKRGEQLYTALGEAGVDDDAGMGHIVRAVRHLECRIDDKTAQDTPATGDDVAGIGCRFDDYD